MTKTALDVTTEALRMIGVCDVSEEPAAADHARAKAHWEAIWREVDETDAAAIDYTTETVPERVFLHAARAVAGSVCTGYGPAFAQYAGLYQLGLDGLKRDQFDREASEPTRACYF